MFGFGGGGMFLVLLIGAINVAFWVGLIAAVFFGIRWLMRQSASDRGASGRDDSALELLRQRFARGEIDAAEFEERKRTLGG